MTIAIGYRCFKGVIIAADSAIVIPPYQLQEGSKLSTLWGKAGNFAIANSSEDGNATATLLTEILHDLDRVVFKTYRDLAGAFKQRMTEWREGFGVGNPPAMQFILGAKLVGQDPRLFFCELPNTVREIDDYIAAGSGANVTDPLYSTFFGKNGGEYADVQVVLRRIAYLIYRAKKDDVYCGKTTECTVVGPDEVGLIEVEREDLELAETHSKDIDFLLGGAVIFATGSDEASLERDCADLADMLKETNLRRVVFRDGAGVPIKL